jgi:hypothetical protein
VAEGNDGGAWAEIARLVEGVTVENLEATRSKVLAIVKAAADGQRE